MIKKKSLKEELLAKHKKKAPKKSKVEKSPKEQKEERILKNKKKWEEKKEKANADYLARQKTTITYNPYAKGINVDKLIEGFKAHNKGSKKIATPALEELLKENNLPSEIKSEAYRLLANCYNEGPFYDTKELALAYVNKALELDETNKYAWEVKADYFFQKASFNYTFWRAYKHIKRATSNEIEQYFKQAHEAINKAIALDYHNVSFKNKKDKFQTEEIKFIQETVQNKK